MPAKPPKDWRAQILAALEHGGPVNQAVIMPTKDVFPTVDRLRFRDSGEIEVYEAFKRRQEREPGGGLLVHRRDRTPGRGSLASERSRFSVLILLVASAAAENRVCSNLAFAMRFTLRSWSCFAASLGAGRHGMDRQLAPWAAECQVLREVALPRCLTPIQGTDGVQLAHRGGVCALGDLDRLVSSG